ncbi:glycosyltransferase [Exiguobacterium sp. s151]|uniref:glycosyltransferase n=1 Tax=Exiguobacterium sp. s151 TaxID=2751229 RepID=UPI001BEC34E7|nr:glycosyltransferase [Exiguobacterium sp. s151]
MQFSVLMSVYENDNSDHLKVALNSIFENQTLKPNQIVLVLDGKIPKNLGNVIEEFQMSNPKVLTLVPLKENVGLGEALRIGSSYCKFPYICRMDADDISDSKRFEKQINFMHAHPDIDVLGSNIKEFKNDIDDQNMMIREVPKSSNEILKFAKKRNPMNHVTVCIRKSALEKCGGYETCLLLEDYYLWLKMIANGCKLMNTSESLVYVRVGNGFISKRSSKTRILGWKKLQSYMVNHKMINHFEALMNMAYICGFVLTPNKLKEFLYNNFLRKSI